MKKVNLIAKKVVLLMFINLFSIAAYSQFYINVGGGYNLGIANQTLLNIANQTLLIKALFKKSVVILQKNKELWRN